MHVDEAEEVSPVRLITDARRRKGITSRLHGTIATQLSATAMTQQTDGSSKSSSDIAVASILSMVTYRECRQQEKDYVKDARHNGHSFQLSALR